MRSKKSRRVAPEPTVIPEPTPLELAQEEFLTAFNGMVYGVGLAMGFEQEETTPKDLRVAVNLSIAREEALVSLLLAKGLFTELEWYAAMTRTVEHQRVRYETLLSKYMGQPVALNRPHED